MALANAGYMLFGFRPPPETIGAGSGLAELLLRDPGGGGRFSAEIERTSERDKRGEDLA